MFLEYSATADVNTDRKEKKINILEDIVIVPTQTNLIGENNLVSSTNVSFFVN